MESIILTLLNSLRAKMLVAGINLVVIPHTDPHQSEYMPEYWHTREHFSGFSGSAGTLVVTADDARLWTDSRYFLQAAQQLEGTGITLMRDGLPDTPSIATYITSTLRAGDTVGIDGRLFTVSEVKEMKNRFTAAGINLDINFDPAEGLWDNRPPLPSDPAFIHDVKYAGEPPAPKLARVRADLAAAGAESMLTGAVDEIAWLLNIRGRDVAYNPVVTSYLYIGPDRAILFIDHRKTDESLRAHLAEAAVDVAPYDSVLSFVAALPAGERLLFDPATLSSSFSPALPAAAVEGKSPVDLHKAIRNEAQRAMIHDVMARDGAAMTEAIAELYERLEAGEPLTEVTVDEILTRHRAAAPLFFDLSFPTIAGYRHHGAIVHYEADDSSALTLSPEGLLLIDSGAQYLDGTTDITRTISLGNPTPEERHDFTLVLKGCLDLAAAIFPAGSRGAQLDVLARRYLWDEGKTYLHGTGHGVGHFLNVHEGPQRIRKEEHPQPFVEGMLTSDEPGLYLTDRYGIRCENLLLTVKAFSTPDGGDFLKFETVTLFPFDRNLVDTAIMTEAQLAQLNSYHARVADELMPRLSTDRARRWLSEATAPIFPTH